MPPGFESIIPIRIRIQILKKQYNSILFLLQLLKKLRDTVPVVLKKIIFKKNSNSLEFAKKVPLCSEPKPRSGPGSDKNLQQLAKWPRQRDSHGSRIFRFPRMLRTKTLCPLMPGLRGTWLLWRTRTRHQGKLNNTVLLFSVAEPEPAVPGSWKKN